MSHDHSNPQRPNKLSLISRWVFFGFVAVGAYFLITEHRAHLYGALPFLLLAACPLLHLFHHRGHRHGSDRDSDDESRGAPPSSGPGAHQH